MNGSTAEAESPEEMGRRNFLACACGIAAAPPAVVVGCERGRLEDTANQRTKELSC